MASRRVAGNCSIPLSYQEWLDESSILLPYEDAETWYRAWVNRRVFWLTIWRARKRRLSPGRVLRMAKSYEGRYSGYFLVSGAIHAEAGDRAAARQSLLRALAI